MNNKLSDQDIQALEEIEGIRPYMGIGDTPTITFLEGEGYIRYQYPTYRLTPKGHAYLAGYREAVGAPFSVRAT